MSKIEELGLILHPPFRDVFDLLPKEKFKEIESDILKHGMLDSIKVWQKKIVDGYNRYKIAVKHPHIEFKTQEMHFESDEEALKWIRLNQANRRNLSDVHNKYNIAKVLEINGGDTELTAKEFGVSEEVVKVSKKVASSMDRMPKQLKLDFLSGTLHASIKDITKLNSKGEDEFYEAIEGVRLGIVKSLKDSIKRTKAISEYELNEKDLRFCEEYANSEDTLYSWGVAYQSVNKVRASNLHLNLNIVKKYVEIWMAADNPRRASHGVVKRIYDEFLETFEITIWEGYDNYIKNVYTGAKITEIVTAQCKIYQFFQAFNRNYYMKEVQKSIIYQISRIQKLRKNNTDYEIQYRKLPTVAHQIVSEEIYIPHQKVV